VVTDPPASNPVTTVIDPPAVNVNPPAVTVNPPAVSVYPNPTTNYVTVAPPTTATESPSSTTSNGSATGNTPPVIQPIAESAAPTTDGDAIAHWTLFNVIATILSLLLLMVFVIKMFFDRPKRDQYEEEPVDAAFLAAMTPAQRAQYQKRREQDYQTWLAEQKKQNDKNKIMFVNPVVLLIVVLAVVEALIMLLLTQSFTGAMILFDNFSALFALIVFIQLLVPMVAAVIHNNHKDRTQDQPSPSDRTPYETEITV
jgi:amino acid transporter